MSITHCEYMLYTKEYNSQMSSSSSNKTLTDRLIQLKTELGISHVGTTMFLRITK